MEKKRIIISGGGTGGHIFPALAIAGGLKDRFPDSEILFVGALGKMEMEKVPAAGYHIVGLPVVGFPRKPGLKTLTFFVKLMESGSKARKIINDFKPDVAVGVGGFASGPVLRAAAKKGIPTLIQEQNSYAGITNKILSKRVNKICVAYENMERFFPAEKIIMTGNPVRKNILDHLSERVEAAKFFDLNPADKVVLIVGGSLGARSINHAVLNNLDEISRSGIQFIWQTGAIYYDQIIEKISGDKPANLQVHKFITHMEKAYAAADVIVSRAGAGTISELCLVGKPAILIPSPNVAEDHQTKNALALANKGAAILITDHQIGQELASTVTSLFADQTRMDELATNIKKLAKPDATTHIVNEIVSLLK
jgi:UDP-N-acetylglucosamine--N-acetylmuramyl-(pentapeptide) pyrophosphoryl-undecaprenol N-acetylglucosamine transferase